MHSPDLTQQNLEKIRAAFPNCVTEARDAQGNLKLAIDFDLLKQELSDSIVEGPQERYRLDWPGKREAMLTANAPIAKTLRPARDESVNFDTTENLFIEGDNLDALKLLQESYLGKVKMIYIDPPYNTGNDFIYEDDFSESTEDFLIRSNQEDDDGNRLIVNRDTYGRYHSKWLSMMYSRLTIARNFLRDDGVLVVSIDEKEHSNLIKICDEIFGSENFHGEIVWKNSSKNDQAYISIQHEYLVIYTKDKNTNIGDWKEKKQGLDDIYKAFDGFRKKHGDDFDAIRSEALSWYKSYPESNPINSNKHYNWIDERGIYFPADISGPNAGQYLYDVIHPVTGEICKAPSTGWRYPKNTLEQRIKDNLIHFGKDHTTVPKNKTYLKDTEFQSLTSIRFLDGRGASNRLEKIFGKKVFTNPKDEYLLADLFQAMTLGGNDIILDFFAGSGTTSHAVFELNKRTGSECNFILIQIPEDLNETLKLATGNARQVVKNAIDFLEEKKLPVVISEISKERIRRAGKQILEGECHEDWNKDVGFRVLKVDTSNMKDVYYNPNEISQADLLDSVDHIKPDRSSEDLLFQVLLDWGVDLTLPIRRETIYGKEVFIVDQNALVACFEKEINEELVAELAQLQPLRMVFRDNGFASDSIKINATQIFKQRSPMTDVKSI